jgi:hypothetical protein
VSCRPSGCANCCGRTPNPPSHGGRSAATPHASEHCSYKPAPDTHAVTLISDRSGYTLKVESDAVDVHRFRRLLDTAGRTADLIGRDQLLTEALALWRGPALHNAATDQLRERLCADLNEQYQRTIEASIAIGLELGRHEKLLPELTRLCSEQPVRERLTELHMRALHAAGCTAEALDAYTRFRTRLADQLGLDPSERLGGLRQAILRGERLSETVASAPDATPVRPAQLPADLTSFAGRAEHLGLLDSLLTRPTRAIVISAIDGTGGVGKTALAVSVSPRR